MAFEQLYLSLPPMLQSVPFAALFDGERYLIERTGITYLSPDSYSYDLPLDKERFGRISLPLVIGYSDGGRLPFALEEAERIASSLDHAHLRTEQAATEDQFLTLCRRAGLIHLATHAVFRSDNPFFSWIRLADARPTVNDVYHLRLEGEPLVVVSACETALGSQRAGGRIGLNRALVAAGARAVLASLWKVDDVSTAELMVCFYDRLSAGQAAGDALRAAQLDTMVRYGHPLYWAGFVLLERPKELDAE
jgi:CHAT domain-containing protein